MDRTNTQATNDSENYPELSYLLECYFCEQDDRIDSLVEGYVTANGQEKAREVAQEIDLMLRSFNDEAITQFVSHRSIFMIDDSGRETLEQILEILNS